MIPTRVIVTGDRHWRCEDLAARVVVRLKARYGPGLVIVHGAATGVDSAFDLATIRANVGREPHPAEWKAYGPSAGPRRNAAMVAAGAAFVLAVHRDLKGSKGTKGCVRLALDAGIPCRLIDSEAAIPMRIDTI